MHAPTGSRRNSTQSARWLSRAGAAVLVAVALAACGSSGSKSDAASTTASSSTASSSSATGTASSTGAASSGLPAGLVACNLFDLNSLNSQTGLTWTVADKSSNDSCTITADNGNTVAIGLLPTQGQNDEALTGAQSGCDSGTATPQNVVDGGYTCLISGTPSAGALFKADNILVAISAKTFNNATNDQVQAALVDVLKSFVAH